MGFYGGFSGRVLSQERDISGSGQTPLVFGPFRKGMLLDGIDFVVSAFGASGFDVLAIDIGLASGPPLVNVEMTNAQWSSLIIRNFGVDSDFANLSVSFRGGDLATVGVVPFYFPLNWEFDTTGQFLVIRFTEDNDSGHVLASLRLGR